VRFIPATLRVEDFAQGDASGPRRDHGLDDRPVVLSFGHVIPIRNRVPLIRALPALLERVPDVRVVVVGEVYDDEYRRVADELGVSDHVVTVGRVEHRLVPDYLAAATVECHELGIHGLGITTLEVMAARVPVFAAVRRDVFPGIDLEDWPDIHIIDEPDPAAIADGIAELLTSEDARSRAVEAQFRFVSTYFRSDVVAGTYLALFEELLAAGAGDRPVPGPRVER
jgi:glycosyltransferase involved in cell wall biosynthesis